MALVRKQQYNATSLNTRNEMAKGEELLTEDPVNKMAVQTCLSKLNKYQTKILDLSEQILAITEEAELEAEVNKFETIKNDLLDLITRLEIAFSLEAKPEDEMHTVPSNHTGVDSNQNCSVKLPKLEMTPFDGDPLKFQEFWDTFETTIDQNEGLAPVEKFKYLRSYLRGGALLLAEGYSLTTANYSTVVAVLKQRYGNPELIIYNHLDALVTMTGAGSQVTDLQNTFDECERHIRSLVGLGLPEETFGRVFVPILMSKLPTNVRIALHKKKSPGDCWTLAELRTTLQQEIYAREMGQRSFGTSSSSKNGSGSAPDRNKSNYNSRVSNWGKGGSSRPPTASTLSASTSMPGKSSFKQGFQKVCRFCKASGHFSNQCRKYPDVASRKKVMGKSCFICLEPGHGAPQCSNKKQCFYCQSDQHHCSLCRTQYGTSTSAPSSSSLANSRHERATQLKVDIAKSSSSTKSINVNATVLSHGKRGILQTALAEVSGSKGVIKARILFDNGADNAFVSTKILKKIGARCTGTETISLAGFQDSKRKSATYSVYDMDLQLKNGRKMKISAYGTDQITCPIDKYKLDTKSNPVLTQVTLADPLVDHDEQVEIDILIGSDYYYDIIKTERLPLQGGLVLLDSELGYIVGGRIESASTRGTQMLLTRSQMLESNFDFERLWKLEEVGIKDPPETNEDESALKKFNDSIFFDSNEGRYQVKWPLKDDTPDLPTNFKLAFGRLKSLVNRIKDQKELMKTYQQTIDDQEANGMIERAPSHPDGKSIHYIPHHGVVTPNKSTTKLRIVYDASSKINKFTPSLNDCMYRGPVMLEDLCGLLIRFRLRPVGIVSDIEKAFLQVGLQIPDRDLTRFLWLRDVSKPCSVDNLVHYRFRRVCFGVVASPFLLAATVAHHLKELNNPVASEILNNIYVDNLVGGTENTQDAVKYYKEAKGIFESASMNLREWFSNDQQFRDNISESDRGLGSTTKVLGLTWDIEDDTLSVQSLKAENLGDRTLTKRVVLRTIAKIYDPCGYFSPITITGRMLMQELWQRKYDWDETISDDHSATFNRLMASCEQISDLKINRYFGASPESVATRVELHCFCDASAKAYSAVSYLKVTTPSTTQAGLIFSKSRVSPLKTQSIPRLELIAITIGAKIVDYLERELRMTLHRKVIWSDSQCALHWILGKPVSTRFVKNRVATIKGYSNLEFRYVPTAQNPADLPTRGMSFEEIKQSNLWWYGPLWLSEKESEWPEMPSIGVASGQDDLSDTTEVDYEPLVTQNVTSSETSVPLIHMHRYSSLQKAIKVAGYVLRFVNQATKRSKHRNQTLDTEELKRAKSLLIRETQSIHFAGIFESKRGPMAQLVKQLGLQLDSENIIRCHGRLGNADWPDEAKEPVLLPRNNHFTKLIIEKCHAELYHAGVKHTLAELRYGYWVIHGRSEVKRILSDCLLCKRQKGKSFQIPGEPPLPVYRVKGNRAYSTVGIDYVGPLLIYPADSEPRKIWICLFTCALSRAIHLQIVPSMTAEAFLLAFRRFVADCGSPALIVSDNAKQFITANAVIKKLWQETLESPIIQDFSLSKGIEWKFIIELAPWMGGFYERMVGITKTALKAAIDRKRLNLEELQTIAAEVATIINSRPLVYSEEEVGDHPLTPAHLTVKHHSLQPFLSGEGDDDYIDNPTTADQLVKTWKRIQNIVDGFWNNWNRQYLSTLRERKHRVCRGEQSKLGVEVDMVVLIEDKNLPRGRWRVGKVEQLIKSTDNQVRSASVRLPGGKILNRSLKMLYPLETKNSATLEFSEKANDSVSAPVAVQTAPEIGSTRLNDSISAPVAVQSAVETGSTKTKSSISAPVAEQIAGSADTVGQTSIRKSHRAAALDAKAKIWAVVEDEEN